MRLVLIAIMSLVSGKANGEWITFTEPDLTKVAVLLDIEAGDENVPEADRYIVASPGGIFVVASQIAEKLKGKTVVYDLALSGGAFIANATNAKPMRPDSVKGYHWCRYEGPELIEDEADKQQAIMALIDQQMLLNITNFYTPKYAVKIMGMLDKIENSDFVIDPASSRFPRVMTSEEILDLACFDRYHTVREDSLANRPR